MYKVDWFDDNITSISRTSLEKTPIDIVKILSIIY